MRWSTSDMAYGTVSNALPLELRPGQFSLHRNDIGIGYALLVLTVSLKWYRWFRLFTCKRPMCLTGAPLRIHVSPLNSPCEMTEQWSPCIVHLDLNFYLAVSRAYLEACRNFLDLSVVYILCFEFYQKVRWWMCREKK